MVQAHCRRFAVFRIQEQGVLRIDADLGDVVEVVLGGVLALRGGLSRNIATSEGLVYHAGLGLHAVGQHRLERLGLSRIQSQILLHPVRQPVRVAIGWLSDRSVRFKATVAALGVGQRPWNERLKQMLADMRD